MKFRFHCLGVPHTITHKDYVACAFTQKVLKFCKMMKARGHTILHYGHDKSEVECDENIAVTNDAVLEEAYGNYNWRSTTFKYDLEDSAYTHFYENCIREIGSRKEKGDFLLCFWGWGHKAIADAHPDMIVVEPGIGYGGGIFAPYKVFESQHLMSAYYGMDAVNKPYSMSWYDAVIPNYFDLDDFDYSPIKQDYFLFLGRLGSHKGLNIAIEATQAIGVKLKVAGQGSLDNPPPHVEMVGYADAEKRKELMSEARGQIVLTTYGEPFGGVQIEAMLSGTPVISTDWACFGELNLHGITGYRCRTFEHITWAMENIHTIKPENCRQWGLNFTLEKVGAMYEEFFYSISNVHGKAGWYEKNPDRKDLNWLKRNYPNANVSLTE